ncbi:hypothetical protein NFC81_11695 [Salinispirillum sp. LH 10-3-1]|uniref:Uncharacterized protein n=1 Tax=Salinispirillum sp. LH 10-3-1 TaxID=2952525 RepID=A0AB38YDJ3_9GAMM
MTQHFADKGAIPFVAHSYDKAIDFLAPFARLAITAPGEAMVQVTRQYQETLDQ